MSKGICHAQRDHDGGVPHPRTDKCQAWTPIKSTATKIALCMNCRAAQDGKSIYLGRAVGPCLGGNCGTEEHK